MSSNPPAISAEQADDAYERLGLRRTIPKRTYTAIIEGKLDGPLARAVLAKIVEACSR